MSAIYKVTLSGDPADGHIPSKIHTAPGGVIAQVRDGTALIWFSADDEVPENALKLERGGWIRLSKLSLKTFRATSDDGGALYLLPQWEIVDPLVGWSPTSTVNVANYTGPAGAPVVGQVKVTEEGTAAPFSDVSIPLPGGVVSITAHEENSGVVVVGGSDVTNTADGTGNGLVIPKGITATLMVSDLQSVYLNGSAGDWVTYSAG